MKFLNIMLFNILIISTLITISALNWFTMWLGLEINLLVFIPLIAKSNNIYPAESALKYFLVQSLASSIVLFSIIMNLTYSNMHFNDLSNLIFNSAIFLKMGMAPFHYWFPQMIEGLNWNNSLILLTWQKIAPMVLIMYNLKFSTMISTVIILSSMISSIQGLNQISLRKIMAYSSINHMAWMMCSMIFNSIWMLYFSIYSIITINIIMIFKNFNIYKINQLNYLNSFYLKMMLILNFFSLGGLPPFIGFLPKWMTILEMMKWNMSFLTLMLIIFTLITLYFYIRLMFQTLMFFSTKKINYKKPKLSILTLIFNVLSLSSFLIFNIMFLFILNPKSNRMKV